MDPTASNRSLMLSETGALWNAENCPAEMQQCLAALAEHVAMNGRTHYNFVELMIEFARRVSMMTSAQAAHMGQEVYDAANATLQQATYDVTQKMEQQAGEMMQLIEQASLHVDERVREVGTRCLALIEQNTNANTQVHEQVQHLETRQQELYGHLGNQLEVYRAENRQSALMVQGFFDSGHVFFKQKTAYELTV